MLTSPSSHRVTLEDLYNGKTSKLQLSKSVVCSACGGTGGRSGRAPEPCRSCQGRGIKIHIRQIGPGMVQQKQTMCSDCHGEGEVMNERDRCRACQGQKTTSEVKILEVRGLPDVGRGVTRKFVKLSRMLVLKSS